MDTTTVWLYYHKDLKRFIVSKVKDEQVSDDLLQEVFIRVHTKTHQLIDTNKLKPWLFTIARNIVTDYLKAPSYKTNHRDIVDVFEEEADPHSEHDCLPGIIEGLPDRYRKVLYLADIKGIRQVDIAKKLHRPVSTIKSQVQRGRQLIIKKYMECCDYKLNEEGKLIGERQEKAKCKICH